MFKQISELLGLCSQSSRVVADNQNSTFYKHFKSKSEVINKFDDLFHNLFSKFQIP